MSDKDPKQHMPDTVVSETPRDRMNRRDFSRTLFAGGVLSALSLITIPDQAEAWLDGNFQNREDLGDALKGIE